MPGAKQNQEASGHEFSRADEQQEDTGL